MFMFFIVYSLFICFFSKYILSLSLVGFYRIYVSKHIHLVIHLLESEHYQVHTPIAHKQKTEQLKSTLF